MTGYQGAADLGAEREIDLRSWLDAFRSRWWIAAVGLVVGVVVGGLYSLTGGSTYTATALIAPGQAFNPSGNTPVLTYLTSQTAINAIATSPATIAAAAAEAGIGPGELAGRISTAAVNEQTGQTSSASQTRSAVLIGITVDQNTGRKAEDAANAIARIVQQRTTSPYVLQSIAINTNRLAGYQARLNTLKLKINALTKALREPGLTLNEALLLTIQLDEAQGAYDQTQNAQLTTQQAQSLSEQVEKTQIIQVAKAQKSTARSRRNSVLFGGLIGLIAGAIVAIVVGLRAARSARSPQPA
jgi:uncharacterized protein involved in exopolysaccharide biosynthesis